MIVSLFVVSRSREVCDIVGRLKESALPNEILKKAQRSGTNPQIRALHLKANNYDDIVKSLIELTENTGDALVLIAGDTGKLSEIIYPHVMTFTISDDVMQNPKNVLGSAYGQILKRYMRTREKYQDRGFKKMMLLPMKNCAADELNELFNVAKFDGAFGEFSDLLEKCLASLRSRMKPKKKTAYPHAYFVDDHQKHFQLAIEKHAQADDACPPHNINCVLGLHFRFGLRIDRQEHYNVSRDSDFISGAFVNCHDSPELVKSTTHLNMFPNGQF